MSMASWVSVLLAIFASSARGVLANAKTAGPQCASGAHSCNFGEESTSMLQVQASKVSSQECVDGANACRRHSSLIVVDMQNDFMDDFENATLGVGGASSIIVDVNKLIRDRWDQVFFTTDYHPANHMSFASNNPSNAAAFDYIDVEYDENYRICGKKYSDLYDASSATCSKSDVKFSFKQELWPPHCIQGTMGQHIDGRVYIPKSGVIVRKGITSVVDSYGAFTNNIGFRSKDPEVLRDLTENTMEQMLVEKGVKRVFIVGVAFDFCVLHTAVQAADRGFTTYVIKDATKSVFPDKSKENEKYLKDHGVRIITLSQYWNGWY